MSTAPDVNALFARAETAFQQRRYDAARADLAAVLQVVGEHPAALHLLALVESGAGRVPDAARAFDRALSIAPRDAKILNNFANLLDAQGLFEMALQQYDLALLVEPMFAEARINRATTRHKSGNFDGALADLDAVLAADPGNVPAREARAIVRRGLGLREDATCDLDQVLAADPTRPVALHVAARLATERNDDAAVVHYAAAHAATPHDPEVVLGYAEALEAAGQLGGPELLQAVVAANPSWVAGQDSLARMLSEADSPTDFAAYYALGVATRPGDRALNLGYWHCLARGGRYDEALTALAAARAHLAPGPDIALVEAVLSSEAGDRDRADGAFAGLGSDPQISLARGRHALRCGQPDLAAAVLEPVANSENLVAAWAHLGLAWRLNGDQRAAWLNDQPGLIGDKDLALDARELATLAEVLRGLHRTRAHPIGQSLRGGTQTRGALFDRAEPEVRALAAVLRAAVAEHVAALPAHDDSHPLLRHRDSPLGFTGSWSVRLAGGGYHINHIHPQGVLSSACYIALPDVTGSDRPGWLEVGAPPVELGLDLPPLATVEPRPGRLALFPSYMFHGTRAFPEGERLTVAFDIA